MSTSEANKNVVRRLIEEVMNGRNLAPLDDLVQEDVVANNLPPDWPAGREGYRLALQTLFDVAPDYHCTIEDILAEGDRVAFRCTFTFTHTVDFLGAPPTGRRIAVTGMEILRLVEGKVAQYWDLTDRQSLSQQLGAIPTPRPAPA